VTTPAAKHRYRLRVHDGNPATLADFEAATGGTILEVNSLRRGDSASIATSEGPYIADEPTIEGQTVDLLTGHADVGTGVVRVIDAVTSAATGAIAADNFNGYVTNGDLVAVWPADTSESATLRAFIGPDGSQCIGHSAAGGADQTDAGTLHPFGQFAKTNTRTFTTADGILPSTLYYATIDIDYSRCASSEIGGGPHSTTFGFEMNSSRYLISLFQDSVDPAEDQPLPGDTHAFEMFVGGTPYGPAGSWATYQVSAMSDGSGNLDVTVGVWDNYNFQTEPRFDNLFIYDVPPVGQGRVVTKVLADAGARQQLLSRRAVLEVCDEADCTFAAGEWEYAALADCTTLIDGYVNRLHLADALMWEIVVGGTRREEQTVEIFNTVDRTLG
jgi:hypothetical protein